MVNLVRCLLAPHNLILSERERREDVRQISKYRHLAVRLFTKQRKHALAVISRFVMRHMERWRKMWFASDVIRDFFQFSQRDKKVNKVVTQIRYQVSMRFLNRRLNLAVRRKIIREWQRLWRFFDDERIRRLSRRWNEAAAPSKPHKQPGADGTAGRPPSHLANILQRHSNVNKPKVQLSRMDQLASLIKLTQEAEGNSEGGPRGRKGSFASAATSMLKVSKLQKSLAEQAQLQRKGSVSTLTAIVESTPDGDAGTVSESDVDDPEQPDTGSPGAAVKLPEHPAADQEPTASAKAESESGREETGGPDDASLASRRTSAASALDMDSASDSSSVQGSGWNSLFTTTGPGANYDPTEGLRMKVLAGALTDNNEDLKFGRIHNAIRDTLLMELYDARREAQKEALMSYRSKLDDFLFDHADEIQREIARRVITAMTADADEETPSSDATRAIRADVVHAMSRGGGSDLPKRPFFDWTISPKELHDLVAEGLVRMRRRVAQEALGRVVDDGEEFI
mmetsp:Transcript_52269/g.113598  ORF Transcript_52269/g.113598 Transcript_52269/m.113598 type:complete len:512 (+) Transcript_52269:186-1721(+)